MKISARDDLPGYHPDLIGKVTVWLNGRDVTRECASADDEMGVVSLYARDDRGQIRTSCGRPVMRHVFGRVEIKQTR